MTFVDTSFFYAGLAPEDVHHEAATRLEQRLNSESLVTTNHIRGETWTLTRRRKGHAAAAQMLDYIDRTQRLEIVHVDSEIEHDALAWLRLHDEREYSFVDATSFAFMRANAITEALAFDGDFAAAGFVELRP